MKLKLNNGKTINLELAHCEYTGGIVVEAVNEKGHRVHRGRLLCFQTDGSLLRHEAISDALGFKLNVNGRIKTKKV